MSAERSANPFSHEPCIANGLSEPFPHSTSFALSLSLSLPLHLRGSLLRSLLCAAVHMASRLAASPLRAFSDLARPFLSDLSMASLAAPQRAGNILATGFVPFERGIVLSYAFVPK